MEERPPVRPLEHGTRGYVATFDTKYKAYNYWRPVTAIQNAATDGNPRTKARSDVDPIGDDTTDSGLRLGA